MQHNVLEGKRVNTKKLMFWVAGSKATSDARIANPYKRGDVCTSLRVYGGKEFAHFTGLLFKK